MIKGRFVWCIIKVWYLPLISLTGHPESLTLDATDGGMS